MERLERKKTNSLEDRQIWNNIDAEMTTWFSGKTRTTNPEPRRFFGFGGPDAVREYLSTRGIDLSGLEIDTDSGGKLVVIRRLGSKEPFYQRYFEDPMED